MATGEREREQARHWRHPALPDVDLLRARYIEKTFTQHTHEGFVIAAITEGVEAFRHRGTTARVGVGGLALVNPDTPHTGHAGIPEGWTYSALYPGPEVVAAIAAETTSLRGTAGFAAPVVQDPYASHLVTEVHRAIDEENPLAADTMLRITIAHLLRHHGASLPARPPCGAGARTAVRARDLLRERMAAPPSLEELATELGTRPFVLLRAFRAVYGMPPHTWLTDARVHRARALLDAGIPIAQVAVEVGFTDQPHLNRHFTRIVGVPPGAYQRGHGGRARTYKTAPVPRP